MPKLKSNRGAAKRFTRTASGIKCNASHRRHILTKKTTKRKRGLRQSTIVHPSDAKNISQLIPYV